MLFIAVTYFLLSGRAAAAGPAVNLSTITVSAIKTQGLTVAEYTSLVPTYSTATFDQWTVIGSTALQLLSNVPCPVQLQRQGNMGVFVDTAPFDFGEITDSSTYHALSVDNPNYRIKIVETITWCGDQETALGCSDQPGTNMEIVSNPDNPGEVLAHEFGHNQNLPDVDCSTCTTRIMYGEDGPGQVNVVASECLNYEQ